VRMHQTAAQISPIPAMAYLESQGDVLEEVSPGDFIVLLGDFNAHVGSNGMETHNWKEQPP